MKLCPKCNKTFQSDIFFCLYDGESLIDQTPAGSVSDAETEVMTHDLDKDIYQNQRTMKVAVAENEFANAPPRRLAPLGQPEKKGVIKWVLAIVGVATAFLIVGILGGVALMFVYGGFDTSTPPVTTNEKPDVDTVLGNWQFSMTMLPADFRKQSNEPIPEGVEITMEGNGTQQFHRGGNYSGEGSMTYRIESPDGNIKLKFMLRDVGTWNINGDKITQTTTDGSIIPMDEITKSTLKQSPEVAEVFRPIKGSTVTSTILSIDEREMIIQDDNSKLKVTYTKK